MGRSLNSGTLTTNGGGSAATSSVSITGTDAFAKGDPVFLDYDSGEVIGLNSTHITTALAAGYGSTSVASSLAGTIVKRASTIEELGDGTYILAATTWNSGSGTGLTEVKRFNFQGKLLNSRSLRAYSSDPTAYIITSLLSTGNIGLVYSTQSNILAWEILTPTLSPLYSGTISVTTANPYAIQASNEGGFVLATAYGLFRVTGAGVKSDIALNGGANMTVGTVCTNGDDSIDRNKETTINRNNTSFFPISSSGYGIFYYYSNIVTYHRFNADGSSRGTTSVLTQATAHSLKVARATGGNILYMYNRAAGTTYWGIVADAGTTVLAGAALSDSNTSFPSSVTCAADANDCFFITWQSVTSGTLNMNYVSATGTPKATWPKTRTVFNEVVRLAVTASGVGIFSNSGTAWAGSYSYVNNAGTVLINNATIFDLGSTAGATVDQSMSVTSSGGDIYGFYANEGTSTLSVYSAVFKITGTTGALTVGLGSDTSVKTYESSTFVSGSEVIVCTSNYYRVYDKTTLALKNVTTSALAPDASYLPKYKVFGRSVAMFAGFEFMQGNSTSQVMYVTKPYRTVLLGVAATASTAGAKVTVDTKGVFNTTWNVAQTYDQSGNNPIGNKGSFAGSVVTCLGLGI